MTEGGKHRIAIRGHDPYYENPIRVQKGDIISLSGRTLAWEGEKDQTWLWAIATDGRAGWVGEDLPVQTGQHTVASYDYDAKELRVEPGNSLVVHTCNRGWCLCENDQREKGWVPDRVFKSEQEF